MGDRPSEIPAADDAAPANLVFRVSGMEDASSIPLVDDGVSMTSFTLAQISTAMVDALAAGEELKAASFLAVEASWLALHSWGHVLKLLSRPLQRAACMAWPTIRAGLATFLHRAGAQPWHAIVAELLGLFALLAIWRLFVVLRRRRYVARLRAAFSRRYACLSTGVRNRVQMLRLALPHLAFAGVCTTIAYLFQRLGLRSQYLLCIDAVETWVSTGMPAVRTLLALSTAATSKQRIASLQYWVIWASAHLATGLLLSIPVLPRVLRSGFPLIIPPRWSFHELTFYACIWLQLPSNQGLHAAYALAAPMIQSRASKYGALMPSVPVNVKSTLQLVLSTTIGCERSNAIAEALFEGGILLTGTVFLFTPTPIASVGLLILALGSPLLRTIDVVGAATTACKATATEEAAAVASVAAVVQLRYWLFYMLMRGAIHLCQPVFQWLPFVTHGQLLFVLWLQLPILRSTTRLLSWVLPSWRLFSARSRTERVSHGPKGKHSPFLSQMRCLLTCV
jgi:hypothetical protein